MTLTTLTELHDCIERVIDYNLNTELADLREQLRIGNLQMSDMTGHIALDLMALAEFIGDPVTETCRTCEERVPFLATLPGKGCPQCGAIAREEVA